MGNCEGGTAGAAMTVEVLGDDDDACKNAGPVPNTVPGCGEIDVTGAPSQTGPDVAPAGNPESPGKVETEAG